jgi:hypothetical protein
VLDSRGTLEGGFIRSGITKTSFAVQWNLANASTMVASLGESDHDTVLMWQGPREPDYTRLRLSDPGTWPQWICFAGHNSPQYGAFAITGMNHPEGQSMFKVHRGLFVGPDVGNESSPMLTSASSPLQGHGRTNHFKTIGVLEIEC